MQTDAPIDTDTQILNIEGGENLTISDGGWILNADFVHQGPDLLLLGEGGQKLLIPDYFSVENPPHLVTDKGAVIQADLAMKLAGPALPGQFAQATPTSAAESIGRIETISGSVEVTRTDGTTLTVSQGDSIFAGDVVETSSNGAVGIVLADDSTISLADSGRMVMDELVYDADQQDGNAAISVVQGVFSFVSGQIAKVGPDAMVLRTPLATLGIRGTTIAGRAGAEGEESTFSLLPDANGQIGELTVTNSAGTVLLNQAGATTNLTSAFQPPAPPIVLPVAQVQQQFSAALRSLPAPQSFRAPANNNDPDSDTPADTGDAPAGEGEQGEVPPEGDGEQTPEGELAEGEVPPEGLPGEGLDPEDREGRGDPEKAFEQALAEGASTEEAFEAAADAAIREALENGASPEEAEAAVEAAEAAYQQALADGLSPEDALQLAARAADSVSPEFNNDSGDRFSDGQQDGGTDDGLAGGNSVGGLGFDGRDGPISGGDYFDGGFNSTNNFLFGTEGGGDLYNLGGDGFDLGYQHDFQEPDFFLSNDGFLSFDDGPEDVNDGTVNNFDQIVEGTTGDDDLVAEDGKATRFIMEQGVSLGGTDTITGSGSTDEITFEHLDDILIIYDGTGTGGTNNGTASYAGKGSTPTISGTIHATSLDQVAANTDSDSDINGAVDGGVSTNQNGDGVRLAFEDGEQGIGYILAGSSSADTISLAAPETTDDDYGSLSHSIGSSTILGSIIFAKGGDDTITGTSSGDIIFAGAGADTINMGQDDSAFGGTEDDDFDFTSAVTSATVRGGDGSDTINLAAGTTTLSINSIETINGTTGNESLVLENTVNVNSIDLGAGTDSVVLNSGGNNSISLAGVESVTANAGNDTITINGSTGATITGGFGSDTMTGGSGADAFNYTAIGEIGDVINSFLSGTDSFVFSRSAFNGDGDANGALNALQSGSGLSSSSGSSFFVFDTTNNDLYYDVDASGTATGVLVADLDASVAQTDITFVA